MSQLCMYLPPFSSDYAGVCSSLFELNGMVVIHDAACCSRNYTSFDEPRWFGNKRPIFCSGLREIDAVLGDDEKLIRKIGKALDTIEEQPSFIALLGSPVPTIIGSDMPGLACEVAERFGLPVIGFSTTGLSYYNKGVSAAMLAMARQYGDPGAVKCQNGVNVLGLTPLDFSDNSNAADICACVEAAGMKVVCSYLMGCCAEDLAAAAGAAVNLVVSQSGMELAAYMAEHWGIPYVVGVPVGLSGVTAVQKALAQSASDGNSRVVRPDGLKQGKLLIVGEQVLANAMRNTLTEQYGVTGITVATFFGLDKRLAEEFDISLKTESALMDLLDSGTYTALIGDPLLQELPQTQGMDFFSVPHVAISSQLYWHQYRCFVGGEMEELLCTVAQRVNG